MKENPTAHLVKHSKHVGLYEKGQKGQAVKREIFRTPKLESHQCTPYVLCSSVVCLAERDARDPTARGREEKTNGCQ